MHLEPTNLPEFDLVFPNSLPAPMQPPRLQEISVSRMNPSRMNRSHIQILLFLAAVLTLGAVLAPPLFWAGKWLAGIIVSFKQTETPVIGWIGHKLTSHQFDSYYNRAFLLSALGLLWPFLKWMRLSGDDRGLEENPAPARDAVTGFVLAAGFLALLTALLLGIGAYVMDEKINWSGILTHAVLSGIGAALLEEWLFRGVFLGIALRSSHPSIAIVLVSALFSILHLIKAPDVLVTQPSQREAALTVLRGSDWACLADTLRTNPAKSDWMIAAEYKAFAYSHIGWDSGLKMTAAIFRKSAEPTRFCSEFLTLFAIGVILARARCFTRSLWLPIGLHAGWIFSNALCSGMTKTSTALEAGGYQLAVGTTQIPWIGPELKVGLLPLLTLICTAAVLEWRLRRRTA